MTRRRFGYMCATDYAHEVGEGGASGGSVVYPSVDELMSARPCVLECGISKVEITEVQYTHMDFKELYYSIPNDCILALDRYGVLWSDQHVIFRFPKSLETFFDQNQIIYIGEV